MGGNCGQTSLRARRRSGDPMGEFDRLPPALRQWLSGAVLPWRPASVRRTYARALKRTGCPRRALAELDRIEAKRIAQDVRQVWGAAHPGAAAA